MDYAGVYQIDPAVEITVYDTLSIRRGRARNYPSYAGSAGYARFWHDSGRWEIIEMHPMAMILQGQVDQSSGVEPGDSTFAVDGVTLMQPIGGLLDAMPSTVRNRFSQKLADNDRVLLLWNETDTAWDAFSPGTKASGIQWAKVYGTFTNASGHDAEAVALRLCDQVDRIAAWGGARQRAWSEYFQPVHRYLRDVVRLDPARALTQRLREQMAGAAGRAFTLAVAAALPIKLLRTVAVVRDPAPVARPRGQREREPAPDTGVDPQEVLAARVRASLGGGAAALSQVTAELVGEVPLAERFNLAGNVAQGVAKLVKPRAERERPRVAVDQMVIEDWVLPKPDDGGAG